MLAKKSLGQHFLRCRWVVSTLIKAADLKSTDTVLEIGPGTGVLTRELVKSAGHVIAVEKDEALAERLCTEKLPRTTVIVGDILKSYDIASRKIGAYKVVANIPYYLTSRLIRLLLEAKCHPKIIVLTVQKEVAQRIIAKSPKMNLLALSVQAFGKPEIVKTVPAECFSPKPKVDSAIIKISEITGQFFVKNAIDKEFFFEIVRRAFSQKRKMLTSSLRSYDIKHRVFNMVGRARPQELSLERWAKIASELSTAAKKLD